MAVNGTAPAGAPTQRRRASAALRMTPAGRLAGPQLELRFGLRHQHVAGRRASRTRRRAPRAAGASRAGCRPGRRRAARRTAASGHGVSSTCGSMPAGVALTSRSQLPAAAGMAGVPTRSSLATAARGSRRRAWTTTRRRHRASASAAAARRAAGAQDRGARARRVRGAPASGARNPATSVLRARPAAAASRTSVLTAPTRARQVVAPPRAGGRSTLNGSVTLAPRTSIASANARKSSASAASSGT